MKLKTSLILTCALFLGIFISASCGGAAQNATNNAANKSNTNAANTTATHPTETSNSSNTTTAKTETAPAGDSVGVPECDEYIKKYEACLTSIAKKNPQIESTMKTAFEAQRNGFKTAASTPQGKATLASTCKQAIDTAKSTLSSYACEW